jgi:hypothetical protein
MDIAEIVQIADTFMIGVRRYLGHFNDLIAVSFHWVYETMILPVLYERSIQADMRDGDARIVPHTVKKSCYRPEALHGLCYFQPLFTALFFIVLFSRSILLLGFLLVLFQILCFGLFNSFSLANFYPLFW